MPNPDRPWWEETLVEWYREEGGRVLHAFPFGTNDVATAACGKRFEPFLGVPPGARYCKKCQAAVNGTRKS